MIFSPVSNVGDQSLALYGQTNENSENIRKTERKKMEILEIKHTIYSRNNMRQKCGGNCGLWVLHEIIKNVYPENLKKIVGALWELPAK